VDQVLGRSTDEKGADKAVALRKSQQKERVRLQNEILQSQKSIAELNDARAPIASEVRKVEAEVGPVKYIAAFMYGDNPDQNILERAVRWVIILLVIVFDPLALMLVLAANQSKEWDKEIIEQEQLTEEYLTIQELDTFVGEKPTIEEVAAYEQDDGPLTDDQIDQIKESVKEYVKEPINCYKCGTELIDVPGIGPFCPNKECDVFDNTLGVEPANLLTKEEQDAVDDTLPETTVEPTYVVTNSNPNDNVPIDDTPNFEGVKDTATGEWVQTGPSFSDDTITGHEDTVQPYKLLHGGYVEYQGKRMHHKVLQDLRPDLEIHPDVSVREPKVDFGTSFPESAFLGDIFIRVDVIPSKVFKYNGEKWIEIRRETTDSYLTNDDYIKHLIDKLVTGEYDPDLLTPAEQDVVSEYMRNQNK
jgi:hypothetical protein